VALVKFRKALRLWRLSLSKFSLFFFLENFLACIYEPEWAGRTVSLLSERVARWKGLLEKAAYDTAETQALCDMITSGARAGVIPTQEGGRRVVRRHVSNSQSAYDHESVVDAYFTREVETLGRVLRLGPVLPDYWPEPYVSPVGVIPKARTGKFRLINNLSSGGRWSVNERIPVDLGSVQYVTHRGIAATLEQLGQGTFMFSFDVEDAFRHIPLHPADWQYFLMEWKGCYYVDTRVGFGSRTGPAHYDRLGRALVAIMRHQGVDLLRMVDDHLGFAQTEERCAELQARAHALLAALGLPRAVHKDVDPALVANFTGIRWDTAEMLASIPEEKWAFMLQEIKGVVAKGSVSLEGLRSVVGRLMSAVTIVPRGKAHLQACYTLIADAEEEPGRRHRRGSMKRALSSAILLQGAEALRELQWWANALGAVHAESPTRPIAHIAVGQPCDVDRSLPDLEVYGDASGLALGAVWEPKWALHLVPQSTRVGLRGEVGSTHVELCALLMACIAWGHEWRGRRVRMFSDNSGAVCIWRRRHTRHEALADIVRHMEWRAHIGGYWLEIEWIAGSTNLKADAVSRLQDQAFRQLVPGADVEPTLLQADPLAHWAQWL